MTNDLMTTFLDLCDPFREEIPCDISEQSWHSISHLSKLHGVTPFLYYRARSLGLKLPEQIEKEWLGIYLFQIAQEQKARRQIKELKEVLDSEQIPMILLKGASAILRLYPQPGLRTFVDLDILIPNEVVSSYKKIMMAAGYKQLATMNSPEDEELRKFDGHLDSFWKEEAFMIEPHVNVLGGRGFHLIALPEIWQDKTEINTDGIIIGHLSKEHFIIHTLLHCAKDLSKSGFVEIKGFIDLLYGLRTWRIDWSKLWETAQTWGIKKDILPVVATLNQYWRTEIPMEEEMKPIDLQALMLGVEDWQKQYYAKFPAYYVRRLWQIGELSGISSRVRYLLHLFFPTRENICWRYNLSSKKFMAHYYLLHVLVMSRKFFMGLWHKLLYNPGNDSVT